ncbi:MAG: hypothetical protein U5R31_07765 [Acidimicrobiia bacterium]|nr:hypothetical protein [Acidimicrobiia bacterium]
MAVYRDEFRPSDQLAEPWVIAGVNVIAADREDEAQDQLRSVTRSRVLRFLGVDRNLSDEEADEVVASPQGRQVAQMMTYTGVGEPAAVGEYLHSFAREADADELMVVHAGSTIDARLRSVELVAGLIEPVRASAG